MTVWVDNGGIVGRGVLLDYHAWAETHGISHPAFESTSIPLAHLLKVAESQNVVFRPGDILFVRSGYAKAYDAASPEEIQTRITEKVSSSIGVESCEEILRWIWDSNFAAVAGDQPAWEAWPCQDRRFWNHEWFLAGWGLPIGELFNLETLAAECAKQKKWSFYFSSVPLNVKNADSDLASVGNDWLTSRPRFPVVLPALLMGLLSCKCVAIPPRYWKSLKSVLFRSCNHLSTLLTEFPLD